MFARRKRPGFTLIELLVVIAIIGMLASLLLPVLSTARENGRKTQCMNNMRQMGIAMRSFEGRSNSYPGYVNYGQMTDGTGYKDRIYSTERGTSWAIELLPELDRRDLFDQLRKNSMSSSTSGGSSAGGASGSSSSAAMNFDVYIQVPVFLCPSSPPTSTVGAPMSFVVNTGLPDSPSATSTGPRDHKANGVFQDNWTDNPKRRSTGQKPSGIMQTMSEAFITNKDGLEYTLLLSENIDAGNWNDSLECFLGMNWQVNTPIAQQGGSPPYSVQTLTYDQARINSKKGEGAIINPSPFYGMSSIAGSSSSSGGSGGGSSSGGGASGGASSSSRVRYKSMLEAAEGLAARIESTAGSLSATKRFAPRLGFQASGGGSSGGGSSGGGSGGSKTTATGVASDVSADMAAYARPSSNHPGGVNAIFCDGRYAFLSDQMDYYVYCLLMTSDGVHASVPGSPPSQAGSSSGPLSIYNVGSPPIQPAWLSR